MVLALHFVFSRWSAEHGVHVILLVPSLDRCHKLRVCGRFDDCVRSALGKFPRHSFVFVLLDIASKSKNLWMVCHCQGPSSDACFSSLHQTLFLLLLVLSLGFLRLNSGFLLFPVPM